MAYSDSDWPQGTQTLGRGLSIILAVGAGVDTLAGLSARIGCTRSTTQRMAAALLQHHWLRLTESGHYGLGEKLAAMASRATESNTLVRLARPRLVALHEQTGESVHLAVRSETRLIYLLYLTGAAEANGQGLSVSHQLVGRGGSGRALILDEPEAEWARLHRRAYRRVPSDYNRWSEQMRLFRSSGMVFDVQHGKMKAYSLACPIRDASGTIIAAIGLSGSPTSRDFKPPERLVRSTACQVSAALGWNSPGGLHR